MNKNGSKWITRERRLAIYIRDKFACTWCAADLRDAPAYTVTLDHLIPRSKGGSNASSNLVTSCLACNSSRQETPWRKFARDGATIRRVENARYRVVNIDLARSIIRDKRAATVAAAEASR